MGLRFLQVDPAFGQWAGLHIQPHQLAHTQPAAVQQLDHGRIARLKPSAVFALEIGKLHRIIYAHGFGQGLGCFGGAHILHRVAGDQPLAAQPDVKAAPAAQN